MSSIKNYILDANVLLHDPNSIFAFEENDVYILVSILEEMDRFKTDQGSVGSHARMVARSLDALREKGSLKDGVELESGGRIFVIPFMKNGLSLDVAVVDNQLLTTAHKMATLSGNKTVVVTKDINLRIRADGVGVLAEDYKKDKFKSDSYKGYSDLIVPKDIVDTLHTDKQVEYKVDLPCNHYLRLVSEVDTQHSGLARVGSGGVLHLVSRCSTDLFGIKPKNLEQTFALDALQNEDIKVVTLRGRAGTGKTLLAMAVGLHYVLTDERRKMTITRPVIPVGKDIGFLPGDLNEKMAPWMRPIYDALDAIREVDRKGRHTQIPLTTELDNIIDVAPLSYVRGRSIANSFMIVDEAQNLTPHEVKTLMTRAGNGTKLVFTGDIDQIDNPYLDSESNGFSYLISKFKGQELFAHVELVKGERSRVAELASNIL